MEKRKANLPWVPEKKAHEGRLVTNKFYLTQPWRNFRNGFIQKYPLCFTCQANDQVKQGDVVDHIKPINPADAYDIMGGTFGEPLNENNCQTLCNHCHAVKSGRERHFKKLK